MGQDVHPDDKDPDVWDPPTPQKQQQQQRPMKKAAWDNVERPKKNLNFKKQNSNLGQGGYGNAGGQAKAKKSDEPKGRAYDKPWLAPKKEKKEASTFLDHHYPDGAGPDVDLIQMLERDVLDKNPQVSFDDIAGLDETKKLL